MNKINLFIILLIIPLIVSAQFCDTHFSYIKTNHKLTVSSDSSKIIVEPWQNDMLKVSWFPDKKDCVSDSSFSVVLKQNENAKFSVKEQSNMLIVKNGAIVAHITKNPFAVSFYKTDGSSLLESASDFIAKGNVKSAFFKIKKEDCFYGMGQKSIKVDRRGEAFDVFNQHIGGYTKPYGTMQINTTYVYSPVGFGIYFDNYYPAHFDMGKTNTNEWFYTTENGSLSYYITCAKNEKELLKKYFDLTGFAPLQPKWAYGLIQSKCSYESDTEVYDILKKFDAKKLPIDAIVLDAPWFGGYKPGDPQNMGNFTWNLNKFPDPTHYIATLRKSDIKTIAINEPYFNVSSLNYNFLKEKVWLVSKKGEKTPYVFSPFWAGDASLFDITNPEAQEWLWGKLKNEIESGVDGLWTDLVEPEHPVVDGQYYLGDWRKTHNLYSLLWAKNIAKGYERDFPEKRVFNLSRAGFSGIQRYGVINWSGDASKTWNALKLQIPMLTGTVMSGIPYFCSDIGGFTNAHDRRDGNTIFSNIVDGRMKTQPELYIRWFEHGVFSPFLRPHSGEEQNCEVFAFDSITETITSEYLRLRYRLIPFIYSYAFKTFKEGDPLIRPLFFEFSDSLSRKHDYEYMFGREILVSPVLDEGKTIQDVYLPDSTQIWIDFWNNKSYTGGQTISYQAPINVIPVFVRAGSIIPLGKNKLRADEVNDTLTLRVYPTKKSTFLLYEDDGNSKAYQTGDYALTQLSSKLSYNELTILIQPIEGNYRNKLLKRTWIIEIPVASIYNKLFLNGKEMKDVTFSKEKGLLRFTFIGNTSVKQEIRITEYKSTY